jgi:glycosyltransferase involved in cell wall biosynthesis
VDSVIKQTLNEIEIICINDGSKDGTLNILREYEAVDNRVKVIDLENGGYGRAVNTGIAAATGEYIGIVESDDFIVKSMYKKLYDLCLDGAVDIVKGNFWNYYDLADDKHEIIVNGERQKMPDLDEPFTIREYPEILWGHPSVWSAIYRRDFLRENNIQFMEVKGGGWVDNPFFFETLCKAKSIVWTKEPYYYYRKTNPVSSSNKQTDVSMPFVRMMDNIDVVERNGYTDIETRKRVYSRALQYLRGALLECDYDTNFNIINFYAKQLMQKLEPDVIMSEFHLHDQSTFLSYASPIKNISTGFSKVLIYNWLPFDNQWNFGGGVNLYCKNLVNTILKERPKTMVYFLSSGFAYKASTTEIFIRKINNIFEGRCLSFEIVNSPVPAEQRNLYRNPLVALENPELKGVFSKFLNDFGPFEAIHFNNIEGLSLDVLDLKQEYPDTKFIFSIHNYIPVCITGFYYQRHNKCNCNPGHTKEDCYKCTRVEIEKDLAIKTYKRGLSDFNLKTAALQDNWIEALKLERLDEDVPLDKIFEFPLTCTKKINRNCDHILAVSQRVYDIAAVNGIDKNKMNVSYIGTEIAKEQVKRSLSEYDPEGCLKIVFLGNDLEYEEKGYPFLLDALESLSKVYASQIDVMLTVKQEEHEIINEKLINFHSVKIKQGYKHSELIDILKGCHLGIIPVVWEDNLPQIAIEMAAYGVPVLSSSLGGASELCKSELFKFEGGNSEDFLDKLIHFVENPEDLNEYWKYHTGLKTMSEHWNELVKYYNLQEDTSAIEISQQDYAFLMMENQFLHRYVLNDNSIKDFDQKLTLAKQNADELKQRIVEVEKWGHDVEEWAKDAEGRANKAEQRVVEVEKWGHDVEKWAKDAEGRASKAEQRVVEVEKWAKNAEQRVGETSRELDTIKKSVSFKFGRMMTFMPRKIRNIFHK